MQKILGIVLAIEIGLFGLYYLLGPMGTQYLQKIQHDQQELQTEKESLSKQVNALAQELNSWQKTDFFKEKIAREKLQMSRPGDKIYYLS